MKYRHPDKLIIQIIPEYFDSLCDSASSTERTKPPLNPALPTFSIGSKSWAAALNRHNCGLLNGSIMKRAV
jgi:hypothetical protein